VLGLCTKQLVRDNMSSPKQLASTRRISPSVSCGSTSDADGTQRPGGASDCDVERVRLRLGERCAVFAPTVCRWYTAPAGTSLGAWVKQQRAASVRLGAQELRSILYLNQELRLVNAQSHRNKQTPLIREGRRNRPACWREALWPRS
jgi:hypothetical protein